jgi:putative sterol carrier protein
MTEGKGLPPDTTPERYMEHYLPRALNRRPEELGEIDCVLLFVLTGPGGGEWTLTVKQQQTHVARGRAGEARCTITSSAADWMELVHGRLNGPLAFMTGRFKIGGDYLYAMKLGQMLMTALARR